jgi:hypothetical protein
VAFIEDDIPRRAHMLSHRVKDVVRLDAFSVADEHTRCAPVAQLADVVQLLDVRKAAECAEVPDCRCAPMPGFIWSPPLQALGWLPVEQVHRSHHRFSPEFCRHAPLLEQGGGGCHHSLVRHRVVALGRNIPSGRRSTILPRKW